MNILRKLWLFLTVKKNKDTEPMSEPITDTTVQTATVAAETVAVPVAETAPVMAEVPASEYLVAAKLKALLIAFGHDVEAEFDKLYELAKLAVKK